MKKVLTAVCDGRKMQNNEIINAIFRNRGIDNVNSFLYPNINNLLPYQDLKNIDKAFSIINEGIQQEKSFFIIADTDTDGCTAGAIIYKYLKNITNKIDIYINEGKQHGIADFDINICKSDIVIIVDSINEPECYQKFKGKQVIVFDHHIVPDNFNTNVTLVSSANEYSNPQLSGSGVTWKFCSYMDYMNLTDYAINLVDLAACGIVADMCDVSVPENRLICSWGFKNLKNIGLKKIVGGYKFNSQSISFSIAPLINAANRLNKNDLALELFICDDENEIKFIVKQLKKLKEEQNKIVSELLPKCEEQAKAQIEDKVMVFISENRSESNVSGLIANKLTEKYKRPVLVLNSKGDKYCGSGRGYATDDFSEMVKNTGYAWIGGHENAFGIEVDKDKLAIFKKDINQCLKDYTFKIENAADIQLALEQIDNDLINKFKIVDFISGQGFKPLSVMIANITDYRVESMSHGKHLKIISDGLTLIKWNFVGDFNEFNGEPLTVIGNLDISFFGKKLTKQIIISDYEIGG